MLESIHVESYRTLRNTSVTFRDGLNIIIGQNGVGKSNLLEFIKRYTGYNVLRFFPNVDLKALPSNYRMLFSYVNNKGKSVTMEYAISRNKLQSSPEEREFDLDVQFVKQLDGQVIMEDNQLSKFRGYATSEMLTEIWNEVKPNKGTYIGFNLSADIKYLSSPFSFSIQDTSGISTILENKVHFLNRFELRLEEFYLKTNPSVRDVQSIKARIKKEFEQVISSINLNGHLAASTNIAQVRLSDSINIYRADLGFLIENLVLEFKVNGQWMPWSYLSDGTRRSFFLIAQVASAENELILIEEPEIGIHPFQLDKLMTFLKEQSATKQIILSTHSPQVLNALDPDELDQILIASIKKGVTSFRRLTNAQKEKAKMFMTEVGDLSDYWLHSDLEQEEEYEGAGND